MMKSMMKKVISLLLIVMLTLGFVGCNKTDFTDSKNVGETSELKAQLMEAGTVIIDARSREDYDKGHLKGAVHMEPSELTVSDPVAGTIAPKETVEKVLSSKGISADSKIYVYDNNGGVFASRIWWVLKVYGNNNVKVINNGETAIVKDKLELTLEVPDITPTNYIASEKNESLIATIDDVLSVVEGKTNACIIDVRSSVEFDEGAIPEAILYPHTKNLYSDGSFKSARDIYLDYHDLGLSREEPIILYCKTSFRATQTAMLLNEAGFENVKVYDGAWVEWSSKDVPKVEKTDEKATPSASDGS